MTFKLTIAFNWVILKTQLRMILNDTDSYTIINLFQQINQNKYAVTV